MALSFIPLLAILLLNALVVVWVLRQHDRTRSGFFLLVNALSLILWASGQALYKSTELPWALSIPYLGALLVPGNLLYYAVTRPTPLRDAWRGPLLVVAIFGPALVLTVTEKYSPDTSVFFNYSYRTDRLSFLPQRVTQMYVMILLIAAIAVLGVRYYTSTGPEQNTSKHLIATILGPLMFGGFFWAASQRQGAAILPSPTFLFALMGEVGLFVVLRQEELQRPRTISRAIYYLAAVLLAFVLMNVLQEFYIVVQGSIVLERTAGWLLVGVTLTFLLFARAVRIDRLFDEIIFARAAEYRQLVAETRHELKEARERLRRAERLSVVGEVAARVAHEIKNPLGPIRGYTQMMREKLEKDTAVQDREKYLEYLEVIQEEVDSIDRRVRDLLDKSRQPQLLLEDVEVNAVVRRCTRVMRLELSGGREMSGLMLPVTFEANTDNDAGVIRADAARLEEAIFNLLHNALDAMAERTRGRIVVRTRVECGADGTDGIAIVVEDNGPGFPPDKMSQFFEPFFTQKSGGTGLGLAIVKGTIEAHGGTIGIRNRPLGGGEVHIWLPREARENPGALLPKA